MTPLGAQNPLELPDHPTLDPDDRDEESPPESLPIAARAFGEENRSMLIAEYLAGVDEVSASDIWVHIYRLLLWVDRTTGLAHCYESDKSQPGRPWYARSLAFHTWVAESLGVRPSNLANEIDVLFRRAVSDLTASAAVSRANRAALTRRQRAPYEELGLPLPGADSELENILMATLAEYLAAAPPPEVMRSVTERVLAHVGQENKRKNLVGEGFEDALGALLRRTSGIGESHEVHVRTMLHELRGFYNPRGQEKPKQVDIVLVRRKDGFRTLVSCKWSIRSDREEQFASDYTAYAELESAGQDFSYVLVTNEFDPARLAAACDVRWQNRRLFSEVVHVNVDGPLSAYHAAGIARAGGRGRARVLDHISGGRLISLSNWALALADDS